MNHPVSQRATSEAEIHKLVGGILCLDFANTLYGHSETPMHEYLKDYRDLVLWSKHAGVLMERDTRSLLHASSLQVATAAAVFKHAILFRETLFRTFAAVAGGASPQANDLAVLNLERSEALAKSIIRRTAQGFAITWPDEHALDRMLWSIALSAADLLTSGNLERVRMCSGDNCDWLFFDTSRNHNRRWCSMSMCGNRSKARRFRAQSKTRHARSSC